MKTLTLLVCVCALSACFSVSEGQKRPWKPHHKKIVAQQRISHQLQFRPKPQPNWNIFNQKHLFHPNRYRKPSRPIKRQPLPKFLWPPKCPVKPNTGVNSNTPKAATQIPSLSPTSTSNLFYKSPGVTSFLQNPTTISEKTNTGSSDATPSPQPSPTLPETRAAPSSPSPTLTETTGAPSTPSPALTETTGVPSTPSPALTETTGAPSTPSPALTETTATPSTPSLALTETTAAPSTPSLTTPAPQPSSAPLETTAPPNTTPNPSPTTLTPENSETTAPPTTQTTTPVTPETTTVGQTTSSPRQNPNNAFWQNIYEILKYIYGVLSNK